MKSVILAAATTASFAFAAPVVADSQLAAPLGVDATAFTTSELANLTRAYEDGDQSRIDFILSGGSNLTPAEAERAGILAAIDRAIEEGDLSQAQNLRDLRLSDATDTTVSSRDQAGVPVHLQAIADDLGVNAGDFTTGELFALARYQEEGDTAAVRGMIARVAN